MNKIFCALSLTKLTQIEQKSFLISWDSLG